MEGQIVSILDEKALAEQCRMQNRYAQKALFDFYNKKMMTICFRYLKNDDDALEVLNNSFLKVFSKINQYKSEGSLEAWIKRIVINTSIDFVRSNKSYRANFIPTSEFHLFSELQEENNLHFNHFDALDLSKEELLEFVQELPPVSRLVFNMYVIDEFSHRQISEHLKISEGTSKWHLSNARKILKEKINKTVISKNLNSSHG